MVFKRVVKLAMLSHGIVDGLQLKLERLGGGDPGKVLLETENPNSVCHLSVCQFVSFNLFVRLIRVACAIFFLKQFNRVYVVHGGACFLVVVSQRFFLVLSIINQMQISILRTGVCSR